MEKVLLIEGLTTDTETFTQLESFLRHSYTKLNLLQLYKQTISIEKSSAIFVGWNRNHVYVLGLFYPKEQNAQPGISFPKHKVQRAF